jgi:hypothetical protein
VLFFDYLLCFDEETPAPPGDLGMLLPEAGNWPQPCAAAQRTQLYCAVDAPGENLFLLVEFVNG